MFKHYLVSTVRNFWRHKFHTLINILGLAIGLTCCIFILLYIKDDLSYDKFHENADELYRVYVNGKIGEMELMISETAPPTGPAFRDEFPEIKDFTRLNVWNDVQVFIEEVSFIEENIYLVDSGFLSMFTFPLLDGDPGTALNEPNTVVLTESLAEKYFGEEDPMGKTLKFGDDEDIFMVTGVMPDITHQSHFNFVMLVSIYSWDRVESDIWLSHYLNTYLLLEEGADKGLLEEKFDDFVMKFIGPEFSAYMGIPIEQFAEQGNTYGMYLEPVTEIHFNTRFDRPLKPAHSRSYIYIFSLVALFILIIAVINFMNLATAQSQTRSKEVGVRKVVGATRRLIIRQFLAESVVLTLVSLSVALLLVELLIQPFNNMIQLNLSANYTEKWFYIPAILGFTVLIGILAGSYPAFYLSSFNPIAIINKTLRIRVGKVNFRNVLVFIQFLISIFIIIGTLFIYRQIKFVQNKELGFNKEQLLILPNGWDVGENYSVFKEKVLQLPAVKKIARSSSIPGYPSSTNGYKIEGDPREQTYLMETNYADYDFLETYGFEMEEGRYFDDAFGADSGSMLINSATIKTFNLDDPMSLRIISPEIPGIKGYESFEVIGVVKDFHFESMHTDIRPYTLLLWNDALMDGGRISIRLNTENITTTISQIEKIWEEVSPGPITYYFLDDWFNDMYGEEERTGNMFLLFSILAVFIASLGLFGLSAFVAEQRRKEIGIRRVMGSTGFSLIGLLSKQILVLVTLAALLAVPASIFFMRDWLQEFAYKIDLNWYVFVIAYLVAVMIGLIATLYHSISAANRNPADSLRYE